MLLILEDHHKKHLDWLSSASVDVVREFCHISLEFLKSGINAKVYQGASQKLEVQLDVVQNAVEGLMHLFMESSKLMYFQLKNRLKNSLKNLGFNDELSSELLSQYLSHRTDVRSVQSGLAMTLPHYHDLEWRLDVQVASRSLRHQVEPLITLKFHVVNSSQEETVQVLQTDPVNLVHLTRRLEEALQEMNTAHCKRIVRNL